jgi:hypothetical protein
MANFRDSASYALCRCWLLATPSANIDELSTTCRSSVMTGRMAKRKDMLTFSYQFQALSHQLAPLMH